MACYFFILLEKYFYIHVCFDQMGGAGALVLLVAVLSVMWYRHRTQKARDEAASMTNNVMAFPLLTMEQNA